MIRKLSWLLVVVYLLLGFQLSAVRANPITEIITFGDSLSDTGNLFAATGGSFPPPSEGYDSGRFANGPIWVEELASLLGVLAPRPNLAGGTNYSWGGAETGSGISEQGTPNIGTQIDAFLASNTPTTDQLLVIWGGSNNFNNAVGGLPDPSDLVDDITDHITTLANAAPGEDLQFLIPNLPPLGQTVRAQLIGPPISTVLDLLSAQFSALLGMRLDSLSVALGVTIFELDVFGITQAILADPGAFDLTNTTETARLPNGVNVAQPGTGIVPNPEDYLFFDDVHPTTVWHQILGVRAFAAVPEPAILTLLGFGIVGLGFARRRNSHA